MRMSRLTCTPEGQQMLFTWDPTNLCIVFRQWHIRSTLGLVVSLAAIVAIAAGYEALRAVIRRYEVALDTRSESAPRKPPSPSSPLSPDWAHPPSLPASCPASVGESCGLNIDSSLRNVKSLILRPRRSSGQDKIGIPSASGRTSSRPCCTACRTSTHS